VIGAQSSDLLKAAEGTAADNYAVAYYLGMVYLGQGDTDAAITEWDRYLASAPKDGKSDAVREQLTVLKLKQASEYAKSAAQGKVKPEGSEPNTLAVLNFVPGTDTLSPVLSKGLTAMVITDLAKVPQLKVVEREKMQALLQEVRLGQTGVIDEKTALSTGKLLRARSIVRGDLSGVQKEQVKIASSVTETLNGSDLGRQEAEGSAQDLFKMEKQIVFGILKSLGIEKESLDSNVKKSLDTYQTENIEALLSFSRGLDLQDRQQFAEAREAFQKAVQLDPGFGMASESLISTPKEGAMMEQPETLQFMDLAEGEVKAEAPAPETPVLPTTAISSVEEVTNAAQNNLVPGGGVTPGEEAPPFPGTPESAHVR
jgi:TolB-like protein